MCDSSKVIAIVVATLFMTWVVVMETDLYTIGRWLLEKYLPWHRLQCNELVTVRYLPDRWNPAEMSLVEILQTATPVYDLVSMNPHCHINGVIGISDLTGMSARHLSELLWNGRFREIISIFQVRILSCFIQYFALLLHYTRKIFQMRWTLLLSSVHRSDF